MNCVTSFDLKIQISYSIQQHLRHDLSMYSIFDMDELQATTSLNWIEFIDIAIEWTSNLNPLLSPPILLKFSSSFSHMFSYFLAYSFELPIELCVRWILQLTKTQILWFVRIREKRIDKTRGRYVKFFLNGNHMGDMNKGWY